MSRLSIPVSAADHHDGPLNAPVILVEYGDYQCPYCGEAYPLLKALKKRMGDRLCLVFRNFPLTQMHEYALHAAEFAELAAREGKFWQAHDLLYENQDALTDQDLAGYARQLGIDLESLRTDGAQALERVQSDFAGGARSGVNGTPCLFINSVRYDGPRDPATLLAVLDEATRRGMNTP